MFQKSADSYTDRNGRFLSQFFDTVDDSFDRRLKKGFDSLAMWLSWRWINSSGKVHVCTYPGIFICPNVMPTVESLSLLEPNLTKQGSTGLRNMCLASASNTLAIKSTSSWLPNLDLLSVSRNFICIWAIIDFVRGNICLVSICVRVALQILSPGQYLQEKVSGIPRVLRSKRKRTMGGDDFLEWTGRCLLVDA